MVIAGLILAIPMGDSYGFEYKLIGLGMFAVGLLVHRFSKRDIKPPGAPGTISAAQG